MQQQTKNLGLKYLSTFLIFPKCNFNKIKCRVELFRKTSRLKKTLLKTETSFNICI